MPHTPHDAGEGTQHRSPHDAATQNQQGVSEELILGNVIIDREAVKGLHHPQGEQRQHDLNGTVEQLSRPVLTSRQGSRVQRHEHQGDRLNRQTPKANTKVLPNRNAIRLLWFANTELRLPRLVESCSSCRQPPLRSLGPVLPERAEWTDSITGPLSQRRFGRETGGTSRGGTGRRSWWPQRR